MPPDDKKTNEWQNELDDLEPPAPKPEPKPGANWDAEQAAHNRGTGGLAGRVGETGTSTVESGNVPRQAPTEAEPSQPLDKQATTNEDDPSSE